VSISRGPLARYRGGVGLNLWDRQVGARRTPAGSCLQPGLGPERRRSLVRDL